WQRPRSRPYLWIWTLPASSPGNEQRTPATSVIPPNAPGFRPALARTAAPSGPVVPAARRGRPGEQRAYRRRPNPRPAAARAPRLLAPWRRSRLRAARAHWAGWASGLLPGASAWPAPGAVEEARPARRGA